MHKRDHFQTSVLVLILSVSLICSVVNVAIATDSISPIQKLKANRQAQLQLDSMSTETRAAWNRWITDNYDKTSLGEASKNKDFLRLQRDWDQVQAEAHKGTISAEENSRFLVEHAKDMKNRMIDAGAKHNLGVSLQAPSGPQKTYSDVDGHGRPVWRNQDKTAGKVGEMTVEQFARMRRDFNEQFNRDLVKAGLEPIDNPAARMRTDLMPVTEDPKLFKQVEGVINPAGGVMYQDPKAVVQEILNRQGQGVSTPADIKAAYLQEQIRQQRSHAMETAHKLKEANRLLDDPHASAADRQRGLRLLEESQGEGSSLIGKYEDRANKVINQAAENAVVEAEGISISAKRQAAIDAVGKQRDLSVTQQSAEILANTENAIKNQQIQGAKVFIQDGDFKAAAEVARNADANTRGQILEEALPAAKEKWSKVLDENGISTDPVEREAIASELAKKDVGMLQEEMRHNAKPDAYDPANNRWTINAAADQESLASRLSNLDKKVGTKLMEKLGISEIPSNASVLRKGVNKSTEVVGIAATVIESWLNGQEYREALKSSLKAKEYRDRALQAREQGQFNIADKLDKRAEEYEKDASEKKNTALQEEGKLVGGLLASASATGGTLLATYGAVKMGEAGYEAGKGLSERLLKEEFAREITQAQKEGRAPNAMMANLRTLARVAGTFPPISWGMDKIMHDSKADQDSEAMDKRLAARRKKAIADLDRGLQEIAEIEKKISALESGSDPNAPETLKQRQELTAEYMKKRHDLMALNNRLGKDAGKGNGESIAIRTAVFLLPEKQDPSKKNTEQADSGGPAMSDEQRKRFAAVNCNDFPGTEKQWFDDTQEVRCVCPEADKRYNNKLGRCATREEFEIARTEPPPQEAEKEALKKQEKKEKTDTEETAMEDSEQSSEIDPESVVELPDVVGMTYDDAVKAIEAAGLVALLPELGKNAIRPEDVGRVALAVPAVDGQLHRGDGVTPYLFGEAVEGNTVPDVVGLEMRQAADAIEAAGFTAGFELGKETDDPKKDMTVAGQAPGAGLLVEAGREINLFIYTYTSKTKSIPDLSGKTLVDARKALQDLGLSMSAELGEAATRQQDVNHIYKQSPEAWLEVADGSEVTVWIHGDVERAAEQISQPNSDGQTVNRSGGVPYIDIPTISACNKIMMSLFELTENDHGYYSSNHFNVSPGRFARPLGGFQDKKNRNRYARLAYRNTSVTSENSRTRTIDITIIWREPSDKGKQNYTRFCDDEYHKKGVLNYYPGGGQVAQSFSGVSPERLEYYSKKTHFQLMVQNYMRDKNTPQLGREFMMQLGKNLISQIEPYAKLCTDRVLFPNKE